MTLQAIRLYHIGKPLELTLVRSTETMYVCQDTEGIIYRFRKDGTSVGRNTKKSNPYRLTAESLQKIKTLP